MIDRAMLSEVTASTSPVIGLPAFSINCYDNMLTVQYYKSLQAKYPIVIANRLQLPTSIDLITLNNTNVNKPSLKTK